MITARLSIARLQNINPPSLEPPMPVMLLGQNRVLYTMGHDGLLWPWIGNIHPRFRTSYLTSIVVGCFVAFLFAFFNIVFLGKLVSLGTLSPSQRTDRQHRRFTMARNVLGRRGSGTRWRRAPLQPPG